MTMYYRRRKRRNRWKSYLLPLIILVLVFAGIYVLGKGVSYLFSLGDEDSKVELYLEQGSATIEPFGEDTQLSQIIPGQPVFAGDVVRTGASSRAVLVFFEESQIRLAPNTEVEIDRVETSDKRDVVHLNVNRGEIWASVESVDPTKNYDYTIATANMNVKAVGTKFDVKAQLPEYVRVLQGNVVVDIKTVEGGEQRVIETIPVSIAQELALTPSALEAFTSRDTAEVLGAISSEFERSAWYDWNVTLDLNPALVASFTGNSPLANVGAPDEVADIDEEEEEDTDLEDEDLDEEELDDEEEEDATPGISDLPAPVVTSPDNGANVSETSVAIDGTTSSNTEQIEVTSFEEGRPNPYVLQRYEAGDTTWRYIATYNGGNLIEGENKFEVRAIDADGNKSEPTIVTFNYEVPIEEGVDISSSLSDEEEKQPEEEEESEDDEEETDPQL